MKTKCKSDFVWTLVSKEKPPFKEVVDTISPGGQQCRLYLNDTGHWFFPDGSMYIYYTPLMWKKIEQ